MIGEGTLIYFGALFVQAGITQEDKPGSCLKDSEEKVEHLYNKALEQTLYKLVSNNVIIHACVSVVHTKVVHRI